MLKLEATDQVEEIFETAVWVDPSDLRGLADLHTQLEELAVAVAEPSEPEIAQVTPSPYHVVPPV